MDDTDTSHLQSPDATLPASSLANDLKNPLTYSKGLTGVGQPCAYEGQFKRKGRGEYEDVWACIGKSIFCFSDTMCL